jgi:hypothetical protein
MPVGGGVQQLKNVCSGRQHLPRNLDWRAKGETVFLFHSSDLRLIVTDTAPRQPSAANFLVVIFVLLANFIASM